MKIAIIEGAKRGYYITSAAPIALLNAEPILPGILASPTAITSSSRRKKMRKAHITSFLLTYFIKV